MNDGGNAFPLQPSYRMPDGTAIVQQQGDMSLRDYFAAAALTGILANAETMRQGVLLTKDMADHGALPRMNAMLAHAYADAMLTERSKTMTVHTIQSTGKSPAPWEGSSISGIEAQRREDVIRNRIRDRAETESRHNDPRWQEWLLDKWTTELPSVVSMLLGDADKAMDASLWAYRRQSDYLRDRVDYVSDTEWQEVERELRSEGYL